MVEDNGTLHFALPKTAAVAASTAVAAAVGAAVAAAGACGRPMLRQMMAVQHTIHETEVALLPPMRLTKALPAVHGCEGLSHKWHNHGNSKHLAYKVTATHHTIHEAEVALLPPVRLAQALPA